MSEAGAPTSLPTKHLEGRAGPDPPCAPARGSSCNMGTRRERQAQSLLPAGRRPLVSCPLPPQRCHPGKLLSPRRREAGLGRVFGHELGSGGLRGVGLPRPPGPGIHGVPGPA